jgi:multiple sugar transport system substrate-binding protein
VTKSGLERMRANGALKPYLDALPNARLAPTTDPAWDRVKLDVQQNIGLAVQPGGNPKQVLDQLQQNAVAAK